MSPDETRDAGIIEIKLEWVDEGFASHSENRARLTAAGRTRMMPWKGAYSIYSVPFATKRHIVKEYGDRHRLVFVRCTSWNTP